MSEWTGKTLRWYSEEGSKHPYERRPAFVTVSGWSGFSGISGAPGGTSGYSGWSGSAGIGTSGYSGYSSTVPGSSGFSGFSGVGTPGTQGISGYSGYSSTIPGTQGISGYSGFSGVGTPGTQGISGYSGYSSTVPGISGYSGYSSTVPGISGYSGYSSTVPGISGYSGFSGTGTSGYSGWSAAGNVVGPSSSTDGETAIWDGTTGSLLKNAANNITYVPLAGDIQTYVTAASAGDTLVLASGQYIITDTITINKQLNIVGQGSCGFATYPVTPGHGTLITCATAAKTAFAITSDNVRLAWLSINMTGAGDTGITVAPNLVGVVFRSIDTIVVASGALTGIDINGSKCILRDMSFNVTSTDSSAVGVYVHNDATATDDNIVDCIMVTGIANATATYSRGIWCHSDTSTHTITCQFANGIGLVSGGTGADYGVFTDASAFGGDNARINVFDSIVTGANGDYYQTGGNIITLYGAAAIDGVLVGNPTLGGKFCSGQFFGDGGQLTVATNSQSGAAYTLAVGDALVTMTNTAANAVSIDSFASVPFPVGTQIMIGQMDVGQTTIQIVPSSGVTIFSTGAVPGAPNLRTQYSSAMATQIAIDTWYVVGDIV